MRKKRNLLSLALAASMCVTSVTIPAFGAETSESTEQMSQSDMDSDGSVLEDMEYGIMDPVVEEVELPDEDGAYVIYMENDRANKVSLTDDAYEITTDSPEVILETDLSAVQLDQLEALRVQEEEVYVEENIFLAGASDTVFDNLKLEGAAGGEKESRKASEEENEGNDKIKNNEKGAEEDEDDADYEKRLALKRELARQLCQADDEVKGAEWNIQIIHADDVVAETVGEPVKVAVLDSGVEFLADIPVEKSINLVKDEQDLPYYMNDMTGHGTAVADIIHQVCPQAQIYSVKVMDSENRGRLSDVVAGIYWCMEQDVDIINMSFGTSVESNILRKAVEAAAKQGIIMISSAGNGGTGSAVEYPAAFEEVIAVGAVDTGAQKTEESTTGKEVELVAPGEQILTKSMLGLETVSSGTSMAAPHVTGAAALLMQQSKYKDAVFIRKVLDKSSNPLGDENAYGFGLVDVTYAKELLNGYEEIVSSESVQVGDDENKMEIGSVDIDEMTPGEVAQNNYEELKIDAEIKNIDTFEQVSRSVETFEEVGYVEGRWVTDDHESMASLACDKVTGFTYNEICIFKRGARYPDDKLTGGSNYPEWHGWYGWKGENYIANFISATRIAKVGGNTTKVKKVKGQSDATYNRMKSTISKDGISYSTEAGIQFDGWGVILKKWNYNSQNNETQKRWRQIFLYGMALHTATDAFAHNSCYKNAAGEMILISKMENGKDDDRTHYENRWKCAKNTAYWVAFDCEFELVGDIEDFSSYDKKYWKGFYMGDILKFANTVDGGDNPEWMEYCFKAIDCKYPKF